jgi:hypothetical protein
MGPFNKFGLLTAMRTLLAVLIFIALGCQTPGEKVELIEPVTIDSKSIRISGQVSRSKCAQEKAIPLAVYHVIKISSGETFGSKKSKQFLLEKGQNSYSIEIQDYEDYRGIAICPDYSVDSNFSLDLEQCLGRYERKWMLIFSRKMPSDINIDLQVSDCSPNLLKPKEAKIMGCG